MSCDASLVLLKLTSRLGGHVVDSEIQRLLKLPHWLARNSGQLDVSPWSHLGRPDADLKGHCLYRIRRKSAHPGGRHAVPRGLRSHSLADTAGVLGIAVMLHAHQPFLRCVGLYDSQSHQALSPQTSRQAKYAVLVLDWRIRHYVRLSLIVFQIIKLTSSVSLPLVVVELQLML
jgi:hypothetical protein